MKREQLVDEHWELIDEFLRFQYISPEGRATMKHQYKTAFIHGYKHGKEEEQDGVHTERKDTD